MVLKFSDFDFEIVYREGLSNGNADGLSRQAWEAEQSSDEQMKESTVVRRVELDFCQLSKHLRLDACLQSCRGWPLCTLRSTRRQGRIRVAGDVGPPSDRIAAVEPHPL